MYTVTFGDFRLRDKPYAGRENVVNTFFPVLSATLSRGRLPARKSLYINAMKRFDNRDNRIHEFAFDPMRLWKSGNSAPNTQDIVNACWGSNRF